ncbi:precorrin-2 C(20)-methyltransferase [Chitinophaga solisilvae]|uniref:precorrin-2 C(20)-methyltransferase n=1 Tax=Chitinophaga solisilvae TaxID=1233460 RepID=UPI00136BE4E4|nr:precorrin-2 C(20)-methyltransferase [Chitinophaga solisilvae]
MSKQGKIYAVSLGPGDPELITLKGWKALQLADKIYYPASVQDGVVTSYARSVMEHYALTGKIWQPVVLQMTRDRQHNLDAYTEAFNAMRQDVTEGLQVAFVSEGDISFYSTFIYILEHIRVHQLPLEIIPGVPAFLLGAAAHRQPLALLKEKVAIVPLLDSYASLEKYLRAFENIVLIKVRGAIPYILPALEAQQAVMLYGEKLGTAAEFITTEAAALEGRRLPYFSLIILKSNICN